MRRTVLVPAMVCASMFILIIGSWLLIPTSDTKGLETDTRRHLERFSAKLESHLRTNLVIAEHVRREIVAGHVYGKHEFLSEAASVYDLFQDLQAFNWIDADGVIRWVYPPEKNESAQNINVYNLDGPGSVLRSAANTGELRMTPPIDLRQGGSGISVYIPVVRNEILLGFLNIVFRTEPLLLSVMDHGFLDQFHVRILDGNTLVFANADAAVLDSGMPLTHTIALGDRRWTISIAPTAALIAANSSIIDELILAFLLLLTMAISWLIHTSMVRQRKLHTSDVLFRTFIEYSPAAISIKDLNGHYLHVNDRWHQWFNLEQQDITGKTMEYFFEKEVAKKTRAQELQILAEKKPMEWEFEKVLPDGAIVHILAQRFPIINRQGEIIATGNINTNINANKKAEEVLRNALLKAEEASQSKSKFLATMSHELRTPLTAIIGFSEILTGEFFGPVGNKKYIEYARDINHSGQHLLALIDEVLDISAIELGKRNIVQKPIAIADILQNCIKSVSRRAEAKAIALSLQTPSSLPIIEGDETALQQVFLNLLTNAIKFSHSGDTITLSAEADDDKVVIVVADTGDGIKKEQLPDITNPFVKGHSNSLITHEGAGLGLSIVQSFVTAHQGTLNIESKFGYGTSVTVTLPRELHRQVA